jgi:hypothetical protein
MVMRHYHADVPRAELLQRPIRDVLALVAAGTRTDIKRDEESSAGTMQDAALLSDDAMEPYAVRFNLLRSLREIADIA